MKNPKWSRDELILALDFYLDHYPSLPDKNTVELQELSRILNQLMNKLGHTGDSKYRNPNGVYMKLMNFLPFDPRYSGKGLERGGKGDEEVWNLYSDKPATLKLIANNIKNSMDSIEIVSAIDVTDETEADEGKLLTVSHITRERSKVIVKKKKESILKETGELRCECCGFDFSETYGDRGNEFIECHHTTPVSEMVTGAKTKLSDLALLCSNCHRMIHRKSPWLSIEQLRVIIQQQIQQ